MTVTMTVLIVMNMTLCHVHDSGFQLVRLLCQLSSTKKKTSRNFILNSTLLFVTVDALQHNGLYTRKGTYATGSSGNKDLQK